MVTVKVSSDELVRQQIAQALNISQSHDKVAKNQSLLVSSSQLGEPMTVKHKSGKNANAIVGPISSSSQLQKTLNKWMKTVKGQSKNMAA